MKNQTLKSILLSIVFNLFFSQIQYQLKDLCNKPSNNITYCEVVERANGSFEVNFGEAHHFLKRNNYLISEKDTALNFNTLLDALNHMGNKDLEISFNYVTIEDDRNVNHCILKITLPTSIHNVNYKLLKRKKISCKYYILKIAAKIIYRNLHHLFQLINANMYDRDDVITLMYIYLYIRYVVELKYIRITHILKPLKFKFTLKNIIKWYRIFCFFN